MPVEPPIPFVKDSDGDALFPDQKITFEDVAPDGCDPAMVPTIQAFVDHHNALVDTGAEQGYVAAWLEAENRWKDSSNE